MSTKAVSVLQTNDNEAVLEEPHPTLEFTGMSGRRNHHGLGVESPAMSDAAIDSDLVSRVSERNVDLWIARGLTLGPVALAFPVATAAVFAFGTDRNQTADTLAVVYSLGLFFGFSTSLWPLPSLSNWTRFRRIESLCFLFMLVSYFTHLSWELIWLLFHDSIAVSANSAWAYPWWAYIDGGDLRYAQAPANLVSMEILSVLNGIMGLSGLTLWLRSKETDPRGLLLCMATAVVHLYSTSLYFGSEIVAGLPNVDTTSFLDSWIKFGLANAPWIVFPWFVLYWGYKRLGTLD